MPDHEFELNIKLGNATMRTPEDVTRALRLVIAQLEHGKEDASVTDISGNTVGKWVCSFPEDEDV